MAARLETVKYGNSLTDDVFKQWLWQARQVDD